MSSSAAASSSSSIFIHRSLVDVPGCFSVGCATLKAPVVTKETLSVPLSRLLCNGPSNQNQTHLGFFWFFLMCLLPRDASPYLNCFPSFASVNVVHRILGSDAICISSLLTSACLLFLNESRLQSIRPMWPTPLCYTCFHLMQNTGNHEQNISKNAGV